MKKVINFTQAYGGLIFFGLSIIAITALVIIAVAHAGNENLLMIP